MANSGNYVYQIDKSGTKYQIYDLRIPYDITGVDIATQLTNAYTIIPSSGTVYANLLGSGTVASTDGYLKATFKTKNNVTAFSVNLFTVVTNPDTSDDDE